MLFFATYLSLIFPGSCDLSSVFSSGHNPYPGIGWRFFGLTAKDKRIILISVLIGEEMKFHYYSDTDSLYIDLSQKSSTESLEVAEGVVLDFDENGKLVGIDIDNASKIVDLTRLEAEALPIKTLALSQQGQKEQIPAH